MPDTNVPGGVRSWCPRDSGWCDGAICRERGICCANADPERPEDRDGLDIAKVREALVDAAEALEEADCVFWACPGADAPFEDMVTCRVCASAQDVRAAIARLDAALGGVASVGQDGAGR